jgi:streptogramin lyase
VYLYAVNVTGYAGPGIAASTSNAAVSVTLSNSPVTTASDGSFSITGDYSCSSISTTPDLYLLAVGGTPGGVGNPNSTIVLAAGLGPCSDVVADPPYVVVNEVSTVAAAYASAGFATDPYHVSSSGSTLAVRGVEDALLSIENLVTQNTGAANATTPLSVPGNVGTVPQAEINTLANILAACVNSSGSSSMQCQTLFNNAENGTTPAPDTATAALNIAHNPGANVAALFALQAGNPPFIPDLPPTPTPNDFTMALNYSGGGMDTPSTIAIDAEDDVWVVSSVGYVSEFDPIGVALSGNASGYTSTSACIDGPTGIAIDGSGNVWIADLNSPYNLCEFSSAGVQNANAPFTGNGLDEPEGIAIDASNNVWVANFLGSSLSKFNSSGTAVASYTTGGTEPYGVAVDASGNIWATNQGGTPSITELNSAGSAVGTSPFKGGGLDGPEGIAIDGSGNVWAANYGGTSGSISEFDSSGTAKSGSPFTGGGLDVPYNVAVDGNGDIWAVNDANNSITELNSSGTAISGVNGYQGSLTGLNGLYSPFALAIDGSGNIWVTNGATSTITEFVGAASPVVTPVVANLQGSYASNHSAVNRP